MPMSDTRMSSVTKDWLQQHLDVSRQRLEEAQEALRLGVKVANLTSWRLRRAFSAGAMLLFAAQRVPALNALVPPDEELDDAPDLTKGHGVLGLGQLLAATRQFQAWDDWGSYLEPQAGPPLKLDEAIAWARQIQMAFARHFALPE